MGQSNAARIGITVLVIALAAGVVALVWSSRSDDGDTEGDQSARGPTEPEHSPPPALESRTDAAAEEAPSPEGGSLHDRLGGREAIFAMTGKLLEAAQKNPVIMANERVMTAAKRVNVRKLHQRLTNYVCKEAGGPCTYTGRPMKDYLVPLALTSAEWDAMEEAFAALLAEMSVPEREARELEAILRGLRDGR